MILSLHARIDKWHYITYTMHYSCNCYAMNQRLIQVFLVTCHLGSQQGSLGVYKYDHVQ
jgi:hypothetical protein